MGERADQRIDTAVGVIIRHDGKAEPSLSRTLSLGGVGVNTRRSWPAGTELEIEIVHEGLRLRTVARVVSRIPGGVGLEFVEPSPEFQNGLASLFAALVGGANPARTAPPDSLREVAWAVPEAGSGIAGLFRGRQHKAQLIDVSLDGAAIAAKSPPAVDAEIRVVLPNHVGSKGEERTVECAARVVRHTEHGFAVRFESPSTAFRRVISEIRKAARRPGR